MMFEILLGLLGIVLVVGLVVVVLVLPLIAFVRSRRIAGLEDRLYRLERETRRLQRKLETGATVVESSRAELEAAKVVEVEEAPLVEPVAEESRASPRGSGEARLPVLRREEKPALDLESLIGGRGLGWVAVVLLLFAGGFFLQQVFDRGLIGELWRVAIGLGIGVTLCLAGWRFYRRGWIIFSQMLTAGGIVLLYLSTFATFGFYHLLPREHAVFFFIAIIVEAAFLAILYEAPAIALMAVIGGLLTPVLLHSDRDQYLGLFTYLAVLDAGVVLLAWFRPSWPALSTVALVGSHALFWGWYNENYHPLKLLAAMLFQVTVFGLFLAQGAIANIASRRSAVAAGSGLNDAVAAGSGLNMLSGIEDLVRLIVNAFLFAAAGYVLLDPRYHLWMGTFAVGMAMVYALWTWFILSRQGDDLRHALVTLAVAMAFVAMVFPLQAEAVWIAVGWAVQGLVLWWFGLRISNLALRGLGGAFFIVAVGRLLIVDTPAAHARPFVPLFNAYGTPAVVVAGSLIAAALLARRFRVQHEPLDATLIPLLGLAGVATLWVVLSVETYDYFGAQIERLPETAWKLAEKADVTGANIQQLQVERRDHLRRSAQTALSIMWAAFAAILLAAGLRLSSRPLRWAALGLFGLTLGKVLIVDMGRLSGFYRVLAFLVLSMMMAAGAWGYQKVKRSLLPSSPQEAPHESD